MKIINHGKRRHARAYPIPEEDEDANTQQDRPRKKALLVGIAYLKGEGEGQLVGPYKDVEQMKGLLISKYGYLEGDIVTLLDKPGLEREWQPTRDNMLRRIDELVDGAKPGDKFFFLYAGHGAQTPNRTNTEEDGMDECLVPSDESTSGLILDNELQRRLVKPLPAGSLLTAIFDTCHSESLLDLPHHRCNRVYVPWISKGHRRSYSLWNIISRKHAMYVTSRRIHQRRRLSDSVMEAKELRIRRATTSHSHTHAHEPHTHEKSASSTSTSSSSSMPNPRTSRTLSFSHKSLSGKENHVPDGLKSGKIVIETTKRQRSYGIPLTMSPVSISRSSSRAASPTMMFSPMHRCESPEADFPCDGHCREHKDGRGLNDLFRDSGDVVSISSCKDDQETFDDANGGTMTQIMVDFLDNDPNPTFKNLMVNLSHRMHTSMSHKHHAYRKYREQKKAWLQRNKRRGIVDVPAPERTPDMTNFINPQMASPRPMDMNGRWMP